MPTITRIGRVVVPVAGQDAVTASYRGVHGFSLLCFLRDRDGNELMTVQGQ